MVLRVCGPPRRFARGAGFRCPVLAAGASARNLARDGAAPVRRRDPLGTGGAKLRIFTMRKCSGRAIFSDAATRPPRPRETEDGKKSGGRFRLSSRFVRQFRVRRHAPPGAAGFRLCAGRCGHAAAFLSCARRWRLAPAFRSRAPPGFRGRYVGAPPGSRGGFPRRASPRPPELGISRAPRRRRPRGSPCIRTPRAGGLRARRRPRCP